MLLKDLARELYNAAWLKDPSCLSMVDYEDLKAWQKAYWLHKAAQIKFIPREKPC